MSEKLLVDRLKSLAEEVRGPVREAMLDAAMALSEADTIAARLAEAERDAASDNNRWATERLNLIARLAEAERKNLTAASALVKAFNELNAIRARDGVPRDYSGMKTGVSEEYFSSVVDDVDAAVLALTGRGAHCHPLLYERATDSASVGRNCQTLASLDSEDAARFRWLCDDHADKAVRHLRDSLLERMSVMSLSAVRAAIGIHLSNMPAASADAVPHCGNCGRDGCPYCDPRLTTTVDGVKP